MRIIYILAWFQPENNIIPGALIISKTIFSSAVIFMLLLTCYWHDLYTVEEYERSWEQNEELGLNDIDTSSADAAYESTNNTTKIE